jgi:Fic family protein
MYIYQHKNWPDLYWDEQHITRELLTIRHQQGKLIGKMNALGFELQEQAHVEMRTMDIVKSSEIEGELLDKPEVRSSVARQLGLDFPGLVRSSRQVDSLVNMMLDATENFDKKITQSRLFGWHRSLFPDDYSGAYKIVTGKWRDDSTGPMQVVSRPLGRQRVHFQAPPAIVIPKQMKSLMQEVNTSHTDWIITSALAHIKFLTVHPFDDGNGRIARALTDLLLARSDGQSKRFYSMSVQIQKERKLYYDILEQTQKGSLDITEWMDWYLGCLQCAIANSEELLHAVIFRHDFYLKHATHLNNERQRKMIQKVLSGFEGNITTQKWAKICKCSEDTALRDIQELVKHNVLIKLPQGGRSSAYELNRLNIK